MNNSFAYFKVPWRALGAAGAKYCDDWSARISTQPTAATLSPIRTPAFTIVSQSEGSRETHACWSA